ncbi:MAG: hypothetical protein AAF614_21705 [Chloroflexota bacterium]
MQHRFWKASCEKISDHLDSLFSSRQPGEESDPQEVADLIYQCATSDMPIHNVVGADAHRLLGMKNGMPHEEFIASIGALTMPPERELRTRSIRYTR